MTTKTFFVLSAMVFTVTPSRAQARVRITIADEARRTLEDLRVSAAAIEHDADQLARFASDPQVSVESHSQNLMDIKEEINKMGREMAVLDAEHDALPEWEQQAVSKALPLLKDSAANAESALEYLNANKSHLWTETYRGYADQVRQDSEQVAKTLTDYLKLARLEGQERRLQDNLGTAGGN